MWIGIRWIVFFLVLILGPCEAAGTGSLQIGGTTLNFWHIEKWYISCATDKTENKSSCGAELNAFDLPEPKPANLDVNFFMIANRIDLHVIVIHGACISYVAIDPPHLKMNPATEIKWRAEKMDAPNITKSFRDVAGARVFTDDNNLSLQKAIEAEGVLYLKTAGANREVTFSVSTKGYKRVCQSIVTKERELNPGR